MKLTRDAQKAIDVIVSLGGRPLLVGGFVRDWFLGLPSKDIDIEVHGPIEPAQLELALRKIGRVDAVGLSFGVLKFGHGVDISFPRRDSKVAAGHTGFKIEFDSDMTVDEALARRDFTINSIAVDAQTFEVIDPFNGQLDIKCGLISATAPQAFSDDPLRVLRAIQFASRFAFEIDDETAELSHTVVDSFSQLSKERVWAEWEKILTKGKSMKAVSDALLATQWAVHFPEWEAGSAVFADFVLARMDAQGVSGERRAAMILGTMFAGRKAPLKAFCHRIDAPHWLRRAAGKLCETEPTLEHLDTPAFVRVVGRWLGQHVQLQDWLTVRLYGKGHPRWESAREQGILETAKPRLLRGEHLFARGFEAGPVFAVILSQAEVEQDRKGWTTEEEATMWLDQNWKA